MIPYQRIIGKILVTDFFVSFDNPVAVISRSFSEYLPVASPLSLAKILDAQVIDEIHLSWIGSLSQLSLKNFHDLVLDISRSISVPLAVSCRLSSYEDVSTLFSLGADKVIIGSNLFSSPSFLPKIADTYGTQSIVASLDYDFRDDTFFLRDSYDSAISISSLPSVINELGVGEVSLNSISSDGCFEPDSLLTYLDLTQFKVPVLLSGGYRKHIHISNAFHHSVNGVILSSFLAKSDQSVQQIKARLINDGFPLRLY